MLALIQTFLQKHHKWLFSLLLVVVIVSFVFTIGTPGIGGLRKGGPKKNFYGFDLSDQRKILPLLKGCYLEHFLTTGQSLEGTERLQEAVLKRAVLIGLANQYTLPFPDEDQLIAFIKTYPIFQDSQGAFDKERYQEFIKFIQSDPELGETLARQLIAENFRAQKMAQALRGPTHAVPEEALIALQKNKTQVALQVVNCDYKSFEPTLTVTDAQLRDFYDRHPEAYTIPESVSIHCLHFRTDAFKPQVPSPSDELLAEFLKDRIHDSTTNNEPASETPELDLKAAQIDYVAEKALQMARSAANDFVYDLYAKAIPKDSDALEARIDQSGAERVELPPYSQQAWFNAPSHLPPALLQEGFSLNDQTYYKGPFESPSGPVVLLFQKRFPASLPPFEAVQQKVLADYTALEKQKQFTVAVEDLFQQLQALVADASTDRPAALTFERALKAVAAELPASFQRTLQAYPLFTFEAPPPALNKAVLAVVSRSEAGAYFHYLDLPQGAFLIYVQDKLVPYLDPKSLEVAQAFEELKWLNGKFSFHEMLQDLIARALPRAA